MAIICTDLVVFIGCSTSLTAIIAALFDSMASCEIVCAILCSVDIQFL